MKFQPSNHIRYQLFTFIFGYKELIYKYKTLFLNFVTAVVPKIDQLLPKALQDKFII
jgi:hypothetical protein